MEQSWKQSAYYLNFSEPQLGWQAWIYVQKCLVLNPLSYEFKGPEMNSHGGKLRISDRGQVCLFSLLKSVAGP